MKKQIALGSMMILSFMLLSGVAQAVDGVVLIDQAKALAGGVTSVDAPGFPVTIGSSGSYRLSGNLTVPDANTTAIEITAPEVTVDLNGFAIKGPCVCSQGSDKSVTCSPTGVGRGITSASQKDVAIQNGSVKGMGNYGIYLGGANCIVEGIRASSNGQDGIRLTGTAGNNASTTNKGQGIVATTATNNTASYNGQVGITATTVTNSTSTGNAGNGINATTITGCTSNSNGRYGLLANMASNNTASGNTLYGLMSLGGYAQNVLVYNNGTGAQVSGGVNLGQNLCGSTICP